MDRLSSFKRTRTEPARFNFGDIVLYFPKSKRNLCHVQAARIQSIGNDTTDSHYTLLTLAADPILVTGVTEDKLHYHPPVHETMQIHLYADGLRRLLAEAGLELEDDPMRQLYRRRKIVLENSIRFVMKDTSVDHSSTFFHSYPRVAADP